MAIFRKKPITVEAVQWTGINRNEVGGLMGCYPKVIDRRVRIQTLEGAIYASEGDWIIKDMGGCYPCKPDIFEATYERTTSAGADKHRVRT